MKIIFIKLILLLVAFLGLSSCHDPSISRPGYGNDFIYSVGYYGYRPYWGTPYLDYSAKGGMSQRDLDYYPAWSSYVSRW